MSVYTVFGAGSVGTVLAGLLKDAGVDVRLAGRRAVPELTLEGDVETVFATVPVVTEPEGTILLCVHEPDVADVCPQWEGRTVVTFQNGVTAERTAAQWCEVIGAVWRMTCFLERPGVARFTRRGRVIVQRSDTPLADDLRRAGFNVGESDDIAADKWLKLCLNLASTPNALIHGEDHEKPEFGAIKAALMEEARALLQAHGIRAASDGDLALDEEIAKHRRGGGGRKRAVYNDTWRQLSLGRRPKERYHDVITGLGDAPRNAAMARLLAEAVGPECYTVAEVHAAILGT